MLFSSKTDGVEFIVLQHIDVRRRTFKYQSHSYIFKDMSEEDFRTYSNNLKGISERLNDDPHLPQHYPALYDSNIHANAMFFTCMKMLKFHPIPIIDFDRFTDFLITDYFEHYRYYKGNLDATRPNENDALHVTTASGMAEEKLHDDLLTILEQQ